MYLDGAWRKRALEDFIVSRRRVFRKGNPIHVLVRCGTSQGTVNFCPAPEIDVRICNIVHGFEF